MSVIEKSLKSAASSSCHSNDNGLCIFCYKPASVRFTGKDANSTKYFINLLSRFIRWEPKTKKKQSFFCFLSEANENASPLIGSCSDCAIIANSFCSVYHQLKCLELMLEWKMGTLVNIMKLADRVPLRVKQLRHHFKNSENKTTKSFCNKDVLSEKLNDNDSENLSSFKKIRGILIKKCCRRLVQSQPRVSVTRIKENHMNVSTCLQAPSSSSLKPVENFLGWLMSFVAVAILVATKDERTLFKSSNNPHLLPDEINVEQSHEAEDTLEEPYYDITENIWSPPRIELEEASHFQAQVPIIVATSSQVLLSMEPEEVCVKAEQVNGISYCDDPEQNEEFYNQDNLHPDSENETTPPTCADPLLTEDSGLLSPVSIYSETETSMGIQQVEGTERDKEDWDDPNDSDYNPGKDAQSTLPSDTDTSRDDDIVMLDEIVQELKTQSKRKAVKKPKCSKKPTLIFSSVAAAAAGNKMETVKTSNDVTSKFLICSLDGCNFKLRIDNPINKFQFDEHQKLHEPGEYKCEFCDVIESNLLKLSAHQSSMHPNAEDNSAETEFSSKIYENLESKGSRKKKSKNVRNTNCSICFLRIGKSQERNHFKDFHDTVGLDPSQVDKCSVVGCSAYFLKGPFGNGKQMNLHVKRVHGSSKMISRLFKQSKEFLRDNSAAGVKRKSANAHKCKFCNKKLPTLYHALKHSRTCRGRTKKTFTCPAANCKSRFYSEKLLEDHKRLHGTFKCNFCDVSKEHAMDLLAHETEHAANKSQNSPSCCSPVLKFQCVRCEISFKEEFIYQRHYLKVHLGLTLPPCKFTSLICSICKTQRVNAKSLQRHIKTNHKTKGLILKCDQCAAYFVKTSQLVRHKIKAHDYDGKSLGDALISEVYTIHECKECDKKFNSESRLKRHLECHKNPADWQFQCPTCGKMFAGKQIWKQHLRTHDTQKKPFVCQYCGAKYAQRHEWKSHVKKRHGYEEKCDGLKKARKSMPKSNDRVTTSGDEMDEIEERSEVKIPRYPDPYDIF